MVELFLAVKVHHDDKHFVHFCYQLRPVPEQQTWLDFIQDLKKCYIIGEEFVLVYVESMPSMKRICPVTAFVQKGDFRLCFQHHTI
jgi:hypothetical protein